MLLSAQLFPIEYRHPWDISLEKRLTDLCRGERHIAYFYENPDTSTFRYRVFNMVEALNGSLENDVSASWFSMVDTERFDRFIDRADALVICRARFGHAVDSILRRAHLRGIPVVFDVDDLVFNPDYVPLIIDALDQNMESEKVWDNWFAYASRFGATLRRCGRAIATNDFLARKIAEFAPQIQTRVIPNFMNRLQQVHSLAIWEAKRNSYFQRDERIHIGYFSGTPTHNRDFQVAATALARILASDSRVTLRVVGFLQNNDALAPFQDRIETFPLQNFLSLQNLIGEVEINVAPLQRNTFADCKSELKYFEAAVVGTLTVASPSFTFRNAISEGETGLLAAAHEWDTKLGVALQIVDDPLRYAEIAERAHNFVKIRYGWDRHARAIVDAVFT